MRLTVRKLRELAMRNVSKRCSMFNALQTIIREALERLSLQLKTSVPTGLAVLVISLGGFLAARLACWLFTRAMRRIDLDGRLHRSRLGALIDPHGVLSASHIAI